MRAGQAFAPFRRTGHHPDVATGGVYRRLEEVDAGQVRVSQQAVEIMHRENRHAVRLQGFAPGVCSAGLKNLFDEAVQRFDVARPRAQVLEPTFPK